MAIGRTNAQGARAKVALSGTVNVTLQNNTEYRLTGVTSLTVSYPTGSFECWIYLTTGSSITVTFPSRTTYLGAAPEFAKNTSYEISIKDGVVAAAEVVSA